MRIDILTVLPQLLESPFSASIMQRAQDKGHVEIHVHNIRDYSTNKHKNVDDYQYGGGAGMVMSIEPIAALIEKLKAERNYDEIIYMTPDGELFEQGMCNQLSLGENLMILCGHYKGVDERIREHYITKEISIGSYVLSGGELAAAVVVDERVADVLVQLEPVYRVDRALDGVEIELFAELEVAEPRPDDALFERCSVVERHEIEHR